MDCPYQNVCGGCPLRQMETSEYQKYKLDVYHHTVKNIRQNEYIDDEPIFIADGCRRRAEMTFAYRKNNLELGFNAGRSHDIVGIDCCPALEPRINAVLPAVKNFLTELCRIKNTVKIKNKLRTESITGGDIFISAAANGIDILLETDANLSLEQRMCISDFATNCSDIIRVSLKRNLTDKSETIIEKTPPYIDIAGHHVYIPSGTFLQASQEGEQALCRTVLKYIGDDSGKIADLFCGVGTFSYTLCDNLKNKITAVDSSAELLSGFQKTINKLMISNIEIMKRNLFKYPLDTQELKSFEIIVLDPPRAGAASQIKQICIMNEADKPKKIVAVSCNPHTFVNDANMLIDNGYQLCRITPVDQFVYTNHLELVALFEKL